MRYRQYPRYRESGVEWVGEVPEHWEVGNIRRFAAMKTGHTPSRSEPSYWENCDVPWFTLADVWQLREDRIFLGETAEQISVLGLANSSAERLPAGTVVLSRTASVGYSGVMPRPMATSQDFWNWVPVPKLTPLYLLYQFRGMEKDLKKLTMGSTHKTIYQPDAAGLRICVPSRAEQEAIVGFLRARTAEIDVLIAKKRQLIERLEEKRSALISHTVTRGLPPEAARAAGLDPHPKLRPSGVEWIGHVPECWEVTPIKYVARVESGHTPSRSVEEYWVDCTIPWVSLNDSRHLRRFDYISETAFKISQLGLENSSARLLPPGAVVFSRDATVGLCAITTKPMAVSQHFVAYICSQRLLPEFLLLSLKAMVQRLEELSLGATIVTIGMDDVRSLVCPVPPIAEQRSIVEYVRSASYGIDELVMKVGKAIDRLHEYRSALITAAVTGKIDVRERAAFLATAGPSAPPIEVPGS